MNRQKRNSSSSTVNDDEDDHHHHNSTVAEAAATLSDDPMMATATTTNENSNKENTTTPDMTITAARGRTKTTTMRTKTTSTAAEAGIIKSIYCENFMCHRKLIVELNRNVTFIHGQNGSGTFRYCVFLSWHCLLGAIETNLFLILPFFRKLLHMFILSFFIGKSAVLAAIQICLGANARRTHRARNLKDLVRRDASSSNQMPTGAKIRVTLYNRGSDAYQHDVYGDTITVERTISIRAGGDNGYKLLDHNDVVRSKSKKDLDDMLDTL